MPKVAPKSGPNRIFDSEGVKKPLGSLLERSWGPSEANKSNCDRLLGGQETHQGGGRNSEPPTGRQDEAAGRGWGGDKSLSPGTGGEEGLDSKKDYPKPLHALRPGGLGGFRKARLQRAWRW